MLYATENRLIIDIFEINKLTYNIYRNLQAKTLRGFFDDYRQQFSLSKFLSPLNNKIATRCYFKKSAKNLNQCQWVE